MSLAASTDVYPFGQKRRAAHEKPDREHPRKECLSIRSRRNSRAMSSADRLVRSWPTALAAEEVADRSVRRRECRARGSGGGGKRGGETGGGVDWRPGGENGCGAFGRRGAPYENDPHGEIARFKTEKGVG